jgi:hypothetical protein
VPDAFERHLRVSRKYRQRHTDQDLHRSPRNASPCNVSPQ